MHERITYPVNPLLLLAFKCFAESHWGVWVFWALAVWTPCSVPCDESCTFLHHNLMSVDWLYCTRVSGPKFGLLTEQWKSCICPHSPNLTVFLAEPNKPIDAFHTIVHWNGFKHSHSWKRRAFGLWRTLLLSVNGPLLDRILLLFTSLQGCGTHLPGKKSFSTFHNL